MGLDPTKFKGLTPGTDHLFQTKERKGHVSGEQVVRPLYDFFPPNKIQLVMSVMTL